VGSRLAVLMTIRAVVDSEVSSAWANLAPERASCQPVARRRVTRPTTIVAGPQSFGQHVIPAVLATPLQKCGRPWRPPVPARMLSLSVAGFKGEEKRAHTNPSRWPRHVERQDRHAAANQVTLRRCQRQVAVVGRRLLQHQRQQALESVSRATPCRLPPSSASIWSSPERRRCGRR